MAGNLIGPTLGFNYGWSPMSNEGQGMVAIPAEDPTCPLPRKLELRVTSTLALKMY